MTPRCRTFNLLCAFSEQVTSSCFNKHRGRMTLISLKNFLFFICMTGQTHRGYVCLSGIITIVHLFVLKVSANVDVKLAEVASSSSPLRRLSFNGFKRLMRAHFLSPTELSGFIAGQDGMRMTWQVGSEVTGSGLRSGTGVLLHIWRQERGLVTHCQQITALNHNLHLPDKSLSTAGCTSEDHKHA